MAERLPTEEVCLKVLSAARTHGTPFLGSRASITSVGVRRWVLLVLPILVLPALPEQAQAVINDKVAAPQGENIWERSNLFGDLYGRRADLAAHGIYVRLAEVEEVFGNPFGGQRQTVAYEGITHFGLRVDTSKAFGSSPPVDFRSMVRG
jgi:hypothetical protein